ncbi:MAG: phage portal protein [Oscillospiraceae bacterium]|nr:phage portal protein [Oscillospiraceae bacterium]
MRNPLKALFRGRDAPGVENAVSTAPEFQFGAAASGKSVTEETAIQIAAVYACVRVIAETIASLPLHVYESDGKGGSYIAEKHPLEYLLNAAPNEEMTSFIWREQMMTQLLLHGNSYSQIVRNGKIQILSLYPLMSADMTVDRAENGEIQYEYMTSDGESVTLDRTEVFHVPGLGFDGLMGYSPIALEKTALGLSMAAEEYGSKVFSNGATPSGVLMHPNRPKDMEAVRTSWNRAYGGSANAGKVAILTEGMKFERIAMPNNEAQFLETRKFQVSEICRIFRVPPHMIGDLEHATFSNIEHQSISFAVHTIRPWLVRIEQAMNKALFSEQERGMYFAHFNMDGLMRGDYKSRMEGYAIARQNGWMSADDIRDLENMNPIGPEKGGDLYLVNGNMVPITQAGQQTDDTTMTGKEEQVPNEGD